MNINTINYKVKDTINAFFVRKDLINAEFINDFSSSFHYEPLKLWLLKKFEVEQKITI